MDRVYLQEAFRSTELLEEEDFRLDDVGVKDIIDFYDNDEENQEVDVFDDAAEDEEGLKDSYIGSVILECEVCHSPIFKNVEDIVVDEESDLANIEDECPICHSQDGFKIIGQVAPYQEDAEIKVEVEDKPEDEDADDEIEVDDEEDDEDEVEESLKEELDPELEDKLEEIEDAVEDIADTVSEVAEEVCEGECNTDAEEADIDADVEDEADEEEADAAAEEIEEVDESCCKEEACTEECGKEQVREGFEKVDLEMEDKIIHVSEEEKEPVPDAEMITPVSDELEAELMAPEEEAGAEEMPAEETPIEEVPEVESEEIPAEDELEDVDIEDEEPEFEESLNQDSNKETVNEDCCGNCENCEDKEEEMIDYDVDEFNEKEFDELGEAYLKNVYDNVSSFKTSNVAQDNDKLVVEGVITFNSGKQKSTKFIFEAKDATKSGKVRFIGENAQISRGKKSFTLAGTISEGKFIAESLNYNYRVDSNRVYGTVKING